MTAPAVLNVEETMENADRSDVDDGAEPAEDEPVEEEEPTIGGYQRLIPLDDD